MTESEFPKVVATYLPVRIAVFTKEPVDSREAWETNAYGRTRFGDVILITDEKWVNYYNSLTPDQKWVFGQGVAYMHDRED